MDEGAANATEIIHRVVTDMVPRLRFGAARRKEMLEVIARGGEPTGYRPDWIRETTRQVMVLLIQRAALFNLVHPRDHISTDDLIDVLHTGIGKLKNA